jgi:hypothetical protein
MDLNGREHVDAVTENVVSLFGNVSEEIMSNDPLADLIAESESVDSSLSAEQELSARQIVNENQFPDQSMFILEEQLHKLRSNINRIKFYMSDLDDLLPRENSSRQT